MPNRDTSQLGRLQPIQQSRLHIVAAQEIARAIGQGRWNPRGMLPSERELAQILGISRGSVRQALTALETVGAIRKKVGVGTFVTDEAVEAVRQEMIDEMVAEGDALSLVEARQVLEPTVAKLAARRRLDDDLGDLEASLRAMEDSPDGHPAPADYVSADIEFHLCVARASHNPVLCRLCGDIADQMRHAVWLAAALPVVARRASQYQPYHRGIYDAIRAKDAARAGRMASRHLMIIRENLVAISAIANEKAG